MAKTTRWAKNGHPYFAPVSSIVVKKAGPPSRLPFTPPGERLNEGNVGTDCQEISGSWDAGRRHGLSLHAESSKAALLAHRGAERWPAAWGLNIHHAVRGVPYRRYRRPCHCSVSRRTGS